MRVMSLRCRYVTAGGTGNREKGGDGKLKEEQDRFFLSSFPLLEEETHLSLASSRSCALVPTAASVEASDLKYCRGFLNVCEQFIAVLVRFGLVFFGLVLVWFGLVFFPLYKYLYAHTQRCPERCLAAQWAVPTAHEKREFSTLFPSRDLLVNLQLVVLKLCSLCNYPSRSNVWEGSAQIRLHRN